MAKGDRTSRGLGYDAFPAGVSAGKGATPHTFSLSEHPSLSGKRALVTGGAIGVGRGIAMELAREGAEVGIHYYNEREEAEATRAVIEQGNGKAKLIQGDFGRSDGAVNLLKDAHQSLGKIDILINNAGITANLPFLEVTADFYDQLMNVNLRSMFFLTQSMARTMKEESGGIIINLCSLHASFAMNEHSVYAMTKAAIEAFTRNVALELAQFNIRVNAIVPGWCFGENHLRTLGSESRAADAANIPAGYISNPLTIGRLAVHLCSPDLEYFVGQTLVFDGGLSAILPNTGPFNAPQKVRWGSSYIEK